MLKTPPIIILILLSFLTPILAWGSEFWPGWTPCSLCYSQRYAWIAAGTIWLLTFLWFQKNNIVDIIYKFLYILASIAVMSGALIAGYHAGVEYEWWQGPQGCSAIGTGYQSIEALKEALLNQNPVRCDQVQFEVFNISIAGWNFFWSLLLLAYAIIKRNDANKNC